MNQTQINTLSAAIASLLTTVMATILKAEKESTPSIIAEIPKAPTHLHTPAPKKAPVTAKATTVASVVATKTVKGKKAATVAPGLIDVTTLVGLVKARAVAANNRTLAKLALSKAA